MKLHGLQLMIRPTDHLISVSSISIENIRICHLKLLDIEGVMCHKGMRVNYQRYITQSLAIRIVIFHILDGVMVLTSFILSREIHRKLPLIVTPCLLQLHISSPDSHKINIIPFVLHIPYPVFTAPPVFVHLIFLKIFKETVVLLGSNSPAMPAPAPRSVLRLFNWRLKKVRGGIIERQPAMSFKWWTADFTDSEVVAFFLSKVERVGGIINVGREFRGAPSCFIVSAVQEVRGLRFWEVWIDSICTMVEPVGYRAIDDVGSDGERFWVL
jgi:hypothetical protein